MSHRTTDYLRKNGFVKYVMILRLFLTEDEKEIYKVSKHKCRAISPDGFGQLS